MGIEPFLVTSALDCVLAQRLARRLCERCKEARPFEAIEWATAGWDEVVLGAAPTEGFKAVGCTACGGTGYRGRLAVHEVMPITEEIERLVVARAASDDIRRIALEQGMVSLRTDGLAKVAQGRTTLEEVSRVVV
jgi:type IV pilus assembly protein PilB